MSSYNEVLSVLEKRYDHYSARVVLGQAAEKAGFAADKKGFEPDELKELAAAIASIGTHVEAVVAALNELAEGGAAKKPVPEAAGNNGSAGGEDQEQEPRTKPTAKTAAKSKGKKKK